MSLDVRASLTFPAPLRAPAARPGALRRWLLAGVMLVVAACQSSVQDRLAEIRALQDAGQWRESIEPLRELVAETPDNAEANHLLGAALFQTQQPSLAVYPLEKAAKDPAQAVQSGLLLAMTYLSTESYENAVRAADAVLAVEPNRSAALYARGHAYLGAGQHEKALEDATRLVELTPDDYQALLLRAAVLWDLKRLDEAEKAYVALKDAAAKKDPTTAAKGWLALATFYRNKGDTTRARTEFEAVLAQHPTDATALSFATQFYDEIEEPERATDVWRKAVSEAPESAPFRFALAQRLVEIGKMDEAEKVLVEATELFGTPDTWARLADLRDKQGRHAEAVAAMEKAVELAGGAAGNDQVFMKLAELHANAGDLARARETAAKITEPSYKDILEGRLLLLEDKPKEALERFEAGLRTWPNNTGARLLAGQAAMAIGDYDRAASELREAYRAGPNETDAALVLATMELRRGKYPDAAEFARAYIESPVTSKRPGVVDAYVVLVRAANAAGETALAREAGEKLSALPGQACRGAVEMAAVERRVSGAKSAIAAIEKGCPDLTDIANEPALRALVEDLSSAGRSADAAKRVDAALAKHPDSAALHDLRGRLLAIGGKPDEAAAAFEKAIALQPDFAPSLGALATLKAEHGKDLDGALALYDRAIAASPDVSTYAYEAAQRALGAGRTEEAERRLRAIVRSDPGNGLARNDLAWILAERGVELDTALRLAQDAARLSPRPDVLDTLGWVQLKNQDPKGAVETLRKALEKSPDARSIRYRLGLALVASGDAEGAAREIDAALAATGPFPEEAAARAQLAELGRGSK